MANESDDRWFDLEELAHYSSLSGKTIRRYMKDPERPLPHHHMRAAGTEKGRVLVWKREFDAWLAAFPPLVEPRPRRRERTSETLQERVARALARE